MKDAGEIIATVIILVIGIFFAIGATTLFLTAANFSIKEQEHAS